MQQTSLGGSEYFMLIVDDAIKLTSVFFLHWKGEAFSSFEEWLALVQKESEHVVKIVKANKGGSSLLAIWHNCVLNKVSKGNLPIQVHHLKMVLWSKKIRRWW